MGFDRISVIVKTQEKIAFVPLMGGWVKEKQVERET